MKNINKYGRVIMARKQTINNPQQVHVPDNICQLLARWGAYRDGNTWTLDNIKFTFDNFLHLSIYVNNRFVQGYTGQESIHRMLSEHVMLNNK